MPEETILTAREQLRIHLCEARRMTDSLIKTMSLPATWPKVREHAISAISFRFPILGFSRYQRSRSTETRV
ncbi:hypothetical protein DV706_20600 (plasmid) [Natronorubrum bangense]|uniref:Uncharacterized protein n=1 Tax=Natronorubrum bangense TaxID=61858 RepID=A0A4D6HVR0_9EURY|nr:hypothetical protein DV706_20600 [Natronorubrum bangense]